MPNRVTYRQRESNDDVYQQLQRVRFEQQRQRREQQRGAEQQARQVVSYQTAASNPGKLKQMPASNYSINPPPQSVMGPEMVRLDDPYYNMRLADLRYAIATAKPPASYVPYNAQQIAQQYQNQALSRVGQPARPLMPQPYNSGQMAQQMAYAQQMSVPQMAKKANAKNGYNWLIPRYDAAGRLIGYDTPLSYWQNINDNVSYQAVGGRLPDFTQPEETPPPAGNNGGDGGYGYGWGGGGGGGGDPRPQWYMALTSWQYKG